MAGVVLETVSSRKLIGFFIFLLLLQIAAYLIGGLVAPAPSSAMPTTATKCLDTAKIPGKWFVPWPDAARCDNIESFDDERVEQDHITANDIVFAIKVPTIKNNQDLQMTRWFQSIITVLQIIILYDEDLQPMPSSAIMTMDVRLGYRSSAENDSVWHLLHRSSEEERQLHCNATMPKKDYPLECDILSLFELGSCHHEYYLVNLRLPVDENKNVDIGKIADLHLVWIHWNGGFTKVWFSLKAFFFPFVVAILLWYWRRVQLQLRPPTLLERSLLALGVAMTFLNLPVEFLTLTFDMPYMLLLSDIRQGIFYSVLLCFWVIFAGEHMMDQVKRNRLVWYWKHLAAVGFGCICLFVFEICERGIQLHNPFYSVWTSDTGAKLALTFIILAGAAACVYFLFLSYMLFKVFRNISAKKSVLPHMSERRRKFFVGVIYRFKFLIICTGVCAALTVIFFIIGQVGDSYQKWGEHNQLERRSAFLTGVYAMWNLYVFSLLVLYAPSHKNMANSDAIDNDNDEVPEETVQLSTIPSEASNLATFVRKTAAD